MAEPHPNAEHPPVDIGAPAPRFDAPRDGGGQLSSADFAGKTLVLYFYPKDDTSGCTKEAIAFSSMIDAFSTIDAHIVGVSKDSIKKHDKFVEKHDLKVNLISDEDGDLCERFGVWVEKSMYGKKYMGIERATFLIDGDGVVRQIWRKVKVPGHAEAVLEAAKAL